VEARTLLFLTTTGEGKRPHPFDAKARIVTVFLIPPSPYISLVDAAIYQRVSPSFRQQHSAVEQFRNAITVSTIGMTMDVEMEDVTASGSNIAMLASPALSASAMTTIAHDSHGVSSVVVMATATTGTTTNSSSGDVDMGYEYCAPQIRRASMTLLQEKERRASIKAVMADTTLSPTTKRRSIQFLMDGRRNSTSSAASVVTALCANATASTTATTEALSRSGSFSSTGLVGATTSYATNGTTLSPPPNNLMVICLPCDHDMTTTGGNGMTMMINNEQTKMAECSRPVCSHYDRKCTLIAPCCGRAFGCRICHDECPDLYVLFLLCFYLTTCLTCLACSVSLRGMDMDTDMDIHACIAAALGALSGFCRVFFPLPHTHLSLFVFTIFCCYPNIIIHFTDRPKSTMVDNAIIVRLRCRVVSPFRPI
jgi:hypothetical protein